MQHNAQTGVRLYPAAGVLDVVPGIQLRDIRKKPVGYLRLDLARYQHIGKKPVVVRQRPVRHITHGGDVQDERLAALHVLALDDVDELVVSKFVDFIKNSHVRVQAVQPFAVAGAMADAGAHRVIVYAVAQRAEALRQRLAGANLPQTLVENDARLVFAVRQQVNIRAAFAILASAKGRIARHQRAFAVAGADQNQSFAESAQPCPLVYPAVEVALNEALPRHQLQPVVVALGWY